MSDAARYEFLSAVEVAVAGFKAAQELHGLKGLWFPLDGTFRHFCQQTSFKQEMLDAGYEGDLWGDLGLIKLWANSMRDSGLYVAPRVMLHRKRETSVWLRRSMFVQHMEERYKIPGYRGAKGEHSLKNQWRYWSDA